MLPWRTRPLLSAGVSPETAQLDASFQESSDAEVKRPIHTYSTTLGKCALNACVALNKGMKY